MALKSKFPNVVIPENLSWPDFVFQDFKSYGERTAIVCATTNLSYTFSQVLELSRRFASALTKRGIKKGDVVAMLIPNACEVAVVLLGILQAGGVVTGVNPFFTTEDLTNQLKKTNARWIMVSHRLIHRAMEAARNLNIRHVLVLGDVDGYESISDLLREDSGSSCPAIKFNPKEDLAMLPFSSGISGVSKGVMLTHYNLIALGCLVSANSFLDFTNKSVILADIPFYRTFGVIFILSLGLHRGSSIVSVPRFDQNKFFHHLQDFEVTHLCTDSSHVNLLANHPAVDNFDLKSLGEIISTGTSVSEEVSRNVMNRIPQLRRIKQCYGMTEFCSISHMTPFMNNKHGSVGVLLPNLECKVIEPATGKVLGPGKRGEICVRGPTLMKGYLNNRDATDHVIDHEGWIHTGDVGFYDDDEHFYIVDKLKDVIKFRGHQVPAAELESVLRSHPAIKEAVVIGIPHPEVGELPMAYVVSNNEHELTDIEVVQFVDENVAPHKKLRGGVEFIAAIPRSPNGEILRSQLRDRAKKRKASKPVVRRMSSLRFEDRRFSRKMQSNRSTVVFRDTARFSGVTAPKNAVRSNSCVVL